MKPMIMKCYINNVDLLHRPIPSIMRLLTLILAALHHTKGETGNAYHGPPIAREPFTYNGRLYYFYSEKVPWEEASAICEAGEMHLATLDDAAKTKFTAQSIAEAWMVFEDMWIGGKKGEQGKWIWISNGQKIPENIEVFGNLTYYYPPWVDQEIPDRDGKDCLAVDRDGHNDPYFVDLSCKVGRPFICEAKGKDDGNEPWAGQNVTINKVEYILFHGRLSWHSAVSFCRQEGFALASIPDMTVATKLAKTMLKSRPEFEDVWIGAMLKGDIWQWVANEEEIKQIPPLLKPNSTSNAPENILTPGFPPWFEADTSNGRNCAIFDRHLCDIPTFITLKCNRQRDFICMKEELDDSNLDIIYIERKHLRYIYFPVESTWDDAFTLCETQGAKMMVLNNMDETEFIMQMMADARNQIDHIWISGKFMGDAWRWKDNDLDEDKYSVIPTAIDDDGFPPWCADSEGMNSESFEVCLNLDRQNHWTPLMYGLRCNETQSVICVMNTTTGDIIVDIEPNRKVRVTVLTKMVSISSNQAESYCHNEVGRLWMPTFTASDDVVANNIKKATEDYVLAASKNAPIKPINRVYHVLGTFLIQGTKVTLQYKDPINGRVIAEVSVPKDKITDPVPENGQCLVGEIESGKFKWTPVNCLKQLYSQIICEPVCSLDQIPYENPDNEKEWDCQASSSKVFDHRMKGMTCTQKCQDGKILLGPAAYQCGETGWMMQAYKIRKNMTSCVANATAFANLKKQADTGSVVHLGLVIDSSSGTPKTHAINKYFLAVVAAIFASKQLKMDITVVSMEAREGYSPVSEMVIDYSGEDCNTLIEPLKNLTDKDQGFRDFGAALALLRRKFGNLNSTAVTVFTTPEANQKGEFKNIARNLQTVSNVFAVGVTKYAPVSQLVSIASRQEDTINSISFKHDKHLYYAAKELLNSCTECKCKTEINGLISNDLEPVNLNEYKKVQPQPQPQSKDTSTDTPTSTPSS